MSMSTTPKEILEAVIYDMDCASQTGFTQIRVLTRFALQSMEDPSAHLCIENVAATLSIISSIAFDAENNINSMAENHGCNYVDEAALRRSNAADQHIKSRKG